MKKKLLLRCATALLAALTRAQAATHYVDATSTNAVPPFTNWANAAAVIQDAVDAAAPGDEILVTNGVYQTGAQAVYGMGNRAAVTKPLTVRSVNGPEVTTIVGSGANGPAAVRCVFLTNGAMLSGFTLTNGAAQIDGGGAWCEGPGAEVSNCVLAGNSAGAGGGGIFGGTLNNCMLTGNSAAEDGGAAEQSTLNNCTLTGNSSGIGGGAASFSTLNNCTVTGNTSSTGGGSEACTLNACTLAGNYAGSGGGAAFSTLTNCIISENSAREYGGGAHDSTLYNCTLSGNSSDYRGGGAFGNTLNNCILTGNSAAEVGGGAFGSTLNNCMVTGNSADYGGGAHLATLNNCVVTGNSVSEGGGGVFNSTLNNCIIYYNSADWFGENYVGSVLNYSCTTPDPGSGVGNITNAPMFVDTNAWSNLRLQSNSPCINAGNNSYLTDSNFTNSFDLDGDPRISGGTVDIGAYEFQSPASTISYAWLQQFGLPTDGSADYVDTDHDGQNNWQEWLAGTDPTNALSVLRLALPVITPTNVTLTWTSVTNRTYTLEQATNLGGAPAFSVLSSNLAGLPGTTSWTDTNAPVLSPRFYQLRVSP